MPLTEGQAAPEFSSEMSLPINGGKTLSLQDLKGKKVVLYFYPKDDTPGCTIEAKGFRDHIDQFTAANTVIVGISKDKVAKHDKFIAKYDLPFDLISDEDGQMIDSYGVWKEKSMYGKTFMGIERTTILLDEDSNVTRIWRKVKVKGHVEEVLDAVS